MFQVEPTADCITWYFQWCKQQMQPLHKKKLRCDIVQSRTQIPDYTMSWYS